MGNIRENVLQMKNMSELILDLAYSALFLQDPHINSEVNKLYDKIRALEKETMKHLFRTRISDDERMIIIEMIDYIKDIAYDAVGLASLSKTRKVPGIVKELLQEADERIITATVAKNSSLANKTIGESAVRTRTKAHIIGIRRGEEWLFEIHKDATLLPGDFVIATGPREARKILRDVASGKLKSL